MSGGPHGLLLAALALSGLGLLTGPLILSLGRGRRATGAVVDGLTLGLVPVMVLLRLLPHVAGELGFLAVALAATAFVLLRSFDRAHHRAAARVGRAFIYSALALHSFTDGVSLAAAVAVTPGRGADLTLTAAFVVHRLPEGLFIATTLLPSYGWRRTLLRTAGLFALTVAGGLAGGALLPHLSERWFDAVVALGLGAMLQLVLHSHADRPSTGSTRALSSLAMLAGAAIAIAVPTPHDLLTVAQPFELPVVGSLWPLFVETAPPLLIGLVLAAALRIALLGSLAARSMAAAARPGILGALLRGITLASWIPTGPSGVVSAARGLLARGVAGGTVSVFTVAAQGLAIEAILVVARVLGVPFALVYGLGVVLAASIAGAWSPPRVPPSVPPSGHAPQPTGWSVLPAWVLRELDQRGAFFVAGLLTAAVIEAAVDARWLSLLPPAAWWVLAALLAIACNAPAFAAAPVIAVLVHKGLPLGAAATALVAGSITDVARVRLLAGPQRSRRWLLGLGAALLCGTTGILLAPVTTGVPAVHGLLAHANGVVEQTLALVVAALLVAGLLRLGPGLWFGQLALWGEVPSDSHDHHDHDQGHPAHESHAGHHHPGAQP